MLIAGNTGAEVVKKNDKKAKETATETVKETVAEPAKETVAEPAKETVRASGRKAK